VAYALAGLERAFPGRGFGEQVRPVIRYAALDRPVREGFVPDASDHWSAYALAEVARWRDPDAAALTPLERAWARKQLGVLGVQVRYEAQRSNEGIDRWLRGRTALGAGVGTLGEALGRWAVVAAAEPALAGQRGWIHDRLRCTAGVLAARQVDEPGARASRAPSVARGAWTQFGITQMDDQQHALSAVLAARAVLHGVGVAVQDADPPGDGDDRLGGGGVLPRKAPVPSSAWLVAIAVVAAWNPARLARGSAGRSRRVVAGGSGVALVAVGLVAAVGGPVLRALDVSVPTAVVAAGAVVALAGAVAIVRVGRCPEPGADGWRGAFVPVLIPLALRPDLLLLALAAGAGGGGWATLGGALAAATASTAFAARSVVAPGASDSPENRRTQGVGLVWGVRVGAVVAVGCGIALVVDGVYAI
jgi:hypothetical protein